MNKIKLSAITLLLVVCMACFTGCQPYYQLLSYLRQANDEKLQEIDYQAGGSYLIEYYGIAFQATLPEHWLVDGSPKGVLTAKTNDGSVNAYFIVHSDSKTVAQTWRQRVAIHQENGKTVEYGQGPDIQGNKTAWLLVDGTFQYIIHIPYAYGDGYLLLYVDDETGADSFEYIKELANFVISVEN